MNRYAIRPYQRSHLRIEIEPKHEGSDLREVSLKIGPVD
jgi:hypothetical protein